MNEVGLKRFIYFLTHSKNITKSQQRKRDELLARDWYAHSAFQTDKVSMAVKTCRHSPHEMINFLSLFSKNDDFKWYTHRWDQEGVELDNLRRTQAEKKKILAAMTYDSQFPINEQTYNQVWNFINFENEKYPWSDNEGQKHHIGWHSILELSQQNPELSVERIKLPDGRLFNDYIRLFKSSIEFRTDLRDKDRFSEFVRNCMCVFINGAVTINYSSQFDDIGFDVNVYCDVIGLRSGLKTICAWIVNYKANGSKVYVDLLSTDECFELKICQEGTYFSNLQKLEQPSGDFASLRNVLFSVCDFEMEGDLRRDGKNCGAIRVLALNQETHKTGTAFSPCKIENINRKIGGVQYILKIFKQ